jgi:hypothetical protein
MDGMLLSEKENNEQQDSDVHMGVLCRFHLTHAERSLSMFAKIMRAASARRPTARRLLRLTGEHRFLPKKTADAVRRIGRERSNPPAASAGE